MSFLEQGLAWVALSAQTPLVCGYPDDPPQRG